MIERRQNKHIKLEQQLNRFMISSEDFDEALVYLDAYEKVNNLQARQALLVAAVIAYCRPFSQNETDENASATSVIKDIAKRLSAQEVELHKFVRILRNKVIAHSVSKYKPVKINFQNEDWFSYSTTLTKTHFDGLDFANFKKIALKMHKESRIEALDLQRKILELNNTE